MELPYRLKQIHDVLVNSRRVLIVAHKKPDGDALGSTSALYSWLKREGKEPVLFCRDLPAKQYQYLDGFSAYTNDEKVFDEHFDAVIVCDSGDLVYAGVDELLPRLPAATKVINIDHHKTNQNYGDFNAVDVEATSTCEMVMRFFETNKIDVDSAMATSMLTGLFTDTSHFSNAATTPDGMEVAGRLIVAGARMTDITNHLLKNKELPILKIWGLALSRLRKNEEQDIAVTFVSNKDFEKFRVDPAAVEGISNFLQAVTGNAESILVLHDRCDGTVKGSMRSVSRDVSKIAKMFGGGGHKLAAGFTIDGAVRETATGFTIV
ncbi:MAG: DHH family phosphoesterase [Patescibacteria group bacterium]